MVFKYKVTNNRTKNKTKYRKKIIEILTFIKFVKNKIQIPSK